MDVSITQALGAKCFVVALKFLNLSHLLFRGEQ